MRTRTKFETHSRPSVTLVYFAETLCNKSPYKNYAIIIHTNGKVVLTQFGYTVEPLYNGHPWDPTFCPL